jgi:hypothetical protein
MTPAETIAHRRAEVEAISRRLAAAQEALRRAEAKERHDAIADALALYTGPLTRRAAALADDYGDYLARSWTRERDFAELPQSATAKRHALHRVARSRDGEELKMRRIFDLAQKCNDDALRLHKPACESSTKQKAW